MLPYLHTHTVPSHLKIEKITNQNMIVMQELEPAILDSVNAWLQGNYDADTKAAIQQMLDNHEHEALTDAFYKDLEFGTGGLRGIMGPGSNRVNQYTLGMATQGLSNYLNQTYPDQQIKVAIAHDSRNNSAFFAKTTADIFSANGIHVYFFDALRPTPELSFAIRELGCKSGVMLTASHNPKEYNGYKAYGADGGQLVSPHDKNVLEEVRKIKSVDEVKFDRVEDNITVIGKDMDEKYLAQILELSVSPEAIQRQKDLSIVFSPIHGTGVTLVPPALEQLGFTNVTVLESQATPDGNFPTVVYPNPEEKEALTLAMQKAQEIDADLVMATDPDADRVGIAVKNNDGEFVLVNGNQTGSLLILYMLKAWEAAGKLDDKAYVVKTIVTTYLIDKIAASKGVECFNTLTGFKYIGEVMTRLEGQRHFIAGGEESYGYLVGELVRDKDAVVSAAFIAEMTAYFKDQGSSLYNALIDMYLEYGIYREKLISITKKGKSGAEEIQAMMAGFRNNPPATLGGSKVVMVKDYKSSESKDLVGGTTEAIDLPSSNVLQFYTEDGSIVSCRPSGTEPKIKFYCSVNDELTDRAHYEAKAAELDAKIDRLMEDLQK